MWWTPDLFCTHEDKCAIIWPWGRVASTGKRLGELQVEVFIILVKLVIKKVTDNRSLALAA